MRTNWIARKSHPTTKKLFTEIRTLLCGISAKIIDSAAATRSAAWMVRYSASENWIGRIASRKVTNARIKNSH